MHSAVDQPPFLQLLNLSWSGLEQVPCKNTSCRVSSINVLADVSKHTASRFVQHSSLSCGKVRTETDVATCSLAVSFDGVPLSCQLHSDIFDHLNRELTIFIKDTIHFRHCHWQSAQVIKEWDEVTSELLVIICKSPWYDFLHARTLQLPATCSRSVVKVQHQFTEFQIRQPQSR